MHTRACLRQQSIGLFCVDRVVQTILLAAGAGLEGVTDVSPASQHLVLSARLYKGTIVFPGEDNGQVGERGAVTFLGVGVVVRQ